MRVYLKIKIILHSRVITHQGGQFPSLIRWDNKANDTTESQSHTVSEFSPGPQQRDFDILLPLPYRVNTSLEGSKT